MDAHSTLTRGFAAALLAACALIMPSAPARAADLADREIYRKLGAEVESELRNGELARWFPACVDRQNGGYHSTFNRQWDLIPSKSKSLVFHARMTWVAAAVAEARPDLRPEYRKYAEHGFSYLKDKLWDKQHGGFYWELASDGSFIPGDRRDKHAYGCAFGIYASAQVYALTRDPAALQLAVDAFHWLDEKGHDACNGGYDEAYAEDGARLRVAPKGSRIDRIGSPYGCKSMNAHIHLLESFTALYRVWPDTTLKSRMEELLDIVMNRMIVEPGAQSLFFTPDFRPVPDLASYGHDVETAYLLLEAAELLGKAHDPALRKTCASLINHALKTGFDAEHGGLYDRGPAYGAAATTTKIWWAQAEALNAFLLMHERETLASGTQSACFVAFEKTWNFIKAHQLDSSHGGWFAEVSQDGKTLISDRKGYDWKAAYHTTRALLLVSDRLRNLADGTNHGNGESALAPALLPKE